MARDCYLTSIDGGRRKLFRIVSTEHNLGEPLMITGYIVNYDGAKIDSVITDEFSKSLDIIDRVIFNNPATIVIWSDGSKTVVKCQPGDEYNKETGLAMCIAKKYLGNKSNFNNVFKKYIEGYDDPIVNGIPKVGTRIKILNAGDGAMDANGKTGVVTTKENSDGRLDSFPGYNVEVKSGEIWRINPNAEIKILNRGK